MTTALTVLAWLASAWIVASLVALGYALVRAWKDRP
jgi:hypothetical protein